MLSHGQVRITEDAEQARILSRPAPVTLVYHPTTRTVLRGFWRGTQAPQTGPLLAAHWTSQGWQVTIKYGHARPFWRLFRLTPTIRVEVIG